MGELACPHTYDKNLQCPNKIKSLILYCRPNRIKRHTCGATKYLAGKKNKQRRERWSTMELVSYVEKTIEVVFSFFRGPS